jgi:hypothetical protein
MMGEGWTWIHLAAVGVVFAGYMLWLTREEAK